jgi:hypothetical protein
MTIITLPLELARSNHGVHTFGIPVVQTNRMDFNQHFILSRSRAFRLVHPELIEPVLAREPLLDLLWRRHLSR